MNFLGDAISKTKVFKIPITLTPLQKKIDDSPARFKIIRAGRKFGKTTYGIYKAIQWLGQPNSRVWFMCSTYRSAKLISWSIFKRMIPTEAMKRKPNDTDLTITLKNGSELYLMGTEDMDMLRGPAPTAVIFEEAALHKREVWHEVIRPNLLVHKSPALFISTPKGFNWFKDLEDAANLSILQGGDEWAVFHFTVHDNPTLDIEEIKQAKRECENDYVWRQEYMAEYEASVGRVFASFSDARHIGSVRCPAGVLCGRSIDWGMRDDTACLWGRPEADVLKNRTVLKVHREYAASDLPASTQAGIILGMTPTDETVDKNIIGHDAAKQDVEMRNLTVKWHFSNAGITPLRVGSKDKKANRQMLQQLITEDRLMIDKSCVKLRKQMLSYEWKDTVMEKTEDGNDDLVDALHSLVELYQYDLFQNRQQDKEVTLIERHKQIAQDYLNKRKFRKFSIDDDAKMPGYDFENTPAGYLS